MSHVILPRGGKEGGGCNGRRWKKRLSVFVWLQKPCYTPLKIVQSFWSEFVMTVITCMPIQHVTYIP
jgi:hypothetical protein